MGSIDEKSYVAIRSPLRAAISTGPMVAVGALDDIDGLAVNRPASVTSRFADSPSISETAWPSIASITSRGPIRARRTGTSRNAVRYLGMDRRRFLRTSSGLLVAFPSGVFLVQACYGADAPAGDSPAAPPAVSGSDAIYTSSIDGDHSHTYAIALSAFATPADTRGDTSTDEGHSHTVSISAAQLQDVERGQAIKVTTGTSESHTHVLTFVKVA